MLNGVNSISRFDIIVKGLEAIDGYFTPKVIFFVAAVETGPLIIVSLERVEGLVQIDTQ